MKDADQITPPTTLHRADGVYFGCGHRPAARSAAALGDIVLDFLRYEVHVGRRPSPETLDKPKETLTP